MHYFNGMDKSIPYVVGRAFMHAAVTSVSQRGTPKFICRKANIHHLRRCLNIITRKRNIIFALGENIIDNAQRYHALSLYCKTCRNMI